MDTLTDTRTTRAPPPPDDDVVGVGETQLTSSKVPGILNGPKEKKNKLESLPESVRKRNEKMSFQIKVVKKEKKVPPPRYQIHTPNFADTLITHFSFFFF